MDERDYKAMNKNVVGNNKIEEKAIDWILNGNVGLSSKTMWACFMDAKTDICHPHDPSDFGRCYKLLEAIPEWKEYLPKLKTLSKEWEILFYNWGELSRMYENRDDEMFNYMQIILKPKA